MKISRRHFLRNSGAIALGFIGLKTFFADPLFGQLLGVGDPVVEVYGKLIPDPNGIIDLPQSFSYRVISRSGDRMDDGLWVPGNHDGMAAFPASNGKTILVRNHELRADHLNLSPFGPGNQLFNQVDPAKVYDSGNGVRPALGGTTTLVYDTKTGKLEKHYLSLSGTLRNCAGGPTPWNSWISCEEDTQRSGGAFEKEHGYNFEVPASESGGLANPIPLKAMGRFNHEAVAVDPKTGIVYQTEDRNNGLIYRFIPDQPGKLAAGGHLQALKLKDIKSANTTNWTNRDNIPVGQPMDVEWLDVENVESPADDLRSQGFGKGAAIFARGEGMWYGKNDIYFACTNGGSNRMGQIWRYVPSPFEGTPEENQKPGQLELFIEPNNSALLENADNVTFAPWGDLILCEDGSGQQFLVGVTPQGKIYKFAKNSLNTSEFAGATFSPDGSALFVNIYSPGLTLAIIGPWRKEPLIAVESKGKLFSTLGQLKRSQLLQNYPNPFNSETWIPYRLEKESQVKINIYSSAGELVKILDLGYKKAGEYLNKTEAAYWDGRSDSNEMVSSGLYFYQLQADDFTAIKKLVVQK